MEKREGIVEGWRLFKLRKGLKGDLMLCSAVVHDASGKGIIVAPRRTNEAKHASVGIMRHLTELGCCPHEGFRCGFNMFKYNERVPNDVRYEGDTVLVRCFGWGKVVPGDLGFRCQYMYPKAIFGATSMSGLIRDLRYEIPFALSDLWKVARLYKIQLEMEVPEWISEKNNLL